MNERAKYQEIYSGESDRWKRYGHTNHGRKAGALVGSGPLLDVGCGWNEFCLARRAAGLPAVGVDFACPGADLNADAAALPFQGKEFETVTAFDMLEHLRPEDVRPVLAEFARVSRRFCFSISYVPSVNKVRGETLHPTVRPAEWWAARIAEAGGQVAFSGGYLVGEWGPPAAPPVRPGETVALVGNGPGLVGAGHGPAIDAHAEIVRFNGYRLAGFEADTGARTTLWSTFGRGMVPGDEAERPDRIIFIHGDNGAPAFSSRELWRVPMTFFRKVRARVQAASVREGAALEKVIPSSGCLVAAWLLEVQDAGRLSLFGFDHFKKDRSSHHHYWHAHNSGRPPEHDGDAEAALFGAWEAEGRLVRF